MKTTNSNFKALTFLFFLLFLISFKSKAQCSQLVNNNLNCSIKVTIIVYDSGCLPCYSVSGVAIGIGGSYPIVCAGCSTPICNIEVYVIDVGGTTVSPSPADFTSGAIAVSSLCGATNTIDYDSGTLTFNVSY